MSKIKNTVLPAVAIILISAGLLGSGCSSVRSSDPARTAREQLLLSTAADRALKSADLGIFKGRKVFVDETFFDSYDSKYALGTVRDALSRAGALLVATAAGSEIVVEARSGALSTDNANVMFGIPTIGVPIPLAGSVSIPEIAFYKSDKDRSTAKFALLAYATQSREHVYSSGPLVGKAYENFYHCLGFISLDNTDIPEKQKTHKQREKYESWAPDYDLNAVNSITNAAPTATTNTPSTSTNSVSK